MQKKIERFLVSYFQALTEAANEGKLPWAARMSQREFEEKIAEMGKNLVLASLREETLSLKGPAIERVLKQLKIKKTQKALRAWFLEQD